MSDPLSKLFGSPTRVKLMRLFLLNRDIVFTRDEIKRRSRVTSLAAGKELAMMKAIGFVRPATATVLGARGARKVSGFRLNTDFKLNEALGRLLFDTDLFSAEELVKRFQPIGKVKLIIVAGIFLREEDNRVDLLLVVDNPKKGVIERVLRQLEAEIGRELNYTVFSSADFQYRVSMYDKFVRDVLDYPHQTVFDKIGLGPDSFNK